MNRSPSPRHPFRADDERLLAVAAGDLGAFTSLYDQRVGLVYGNVLRVLGDAPRSCEVTLEVFVAVWREAVRFDPRCGDALTWLLSCAHGRAVSRARADQERHDRSLRTQPSGELALVVDLEVDAEVDAEVDRPSTAALQRRAIQLAYRNGYTYREIAELLDVPVERAARDLRSGLLRLRGTTRRLSDAAHAVVDRELSTTELQRR